MNERDADGGDRGDAAARRAGAGRPLEKGPSLEEAVATAEASTPTAAGVQLRGADRAGPVGRVSSLLVAVGDGPHSGAVVDTAKALAEATDAWLDLFHVAADAEGTETDGATDAGAPGETPEEVGERILDEADDRLSGFDRADRWLAEGRTPADEIVEQSPYYDLVIVGASTAGAVGRFVFGCTTDAVVDGAAVPVVVVEADGQRPIE